MGFASPEIWKMFFAYFDSLQSSEYMNKIVFLETYFYTMKRMERRPLEKFYLTAAGNWNFENTE